MYTIYLKFCKFDNYIYVLTNYLKLNNNQEKVHACAIYEHTPALANKN